MNVALAAVMTHLTGVGLITSMSVMLGEGSRPQCRHPDSNRGASDWKMRTSSAVAR